MEAIKIFTNTKFGQIRLQIENNEPLFCLNDICNSIGISNSRNVKNRLDLEDVRQMDTPTASGNQQMTFITESGLYEVIIRSDSENAKPFRKWVTSEVLPSIRKHGAYATDQTIESIINDPDNAIRIFTALKEEKQKRLRAEAIINEQAPKALFADAVSTSTHSCLIGELSKILKQNGVEMGQNRLFDFLRRNGYLCQYGERYNQPTQRAMELEIFEVKKTTINKPDGTILISNTTKVTGKGQIYFVNKFLKVENKN